jgi:hypothetical protein
MTRFRPSARAPRRPTPPALLALPLLLAGVSALLPAQAPSPTPPARPHAPIVGATLWRAFPTPAYEAGRSGDLSGRLSLALPTLGPSAWRRAGLAVHLGAVRLSPNAERVNAGAVGLSWRRALTRDVSVEPFAELVAGNARSAPDQGGHTVTEADGSMTYVPNRALRRSAAWGGGLGLTGAVRWNDDLRLTASVASYGLAGNAVTGPRTLHALGLGMSVVMPRALGARGGAR